MGEKETNDILGQSQNLKHLHDITGLTILKVNLVKREYRIRKELGLFNLFLN